MLDLILDLIAGSRGPTGIFGCRVGANADADSSDGAARSVLCEGLLAYRRFKGSRMRILETNVSAATRPAPAP